MAPDFDMIASSVTNSGQIYPEVRSSLQATSNNLEGEAAQRSKATSEVDRTRTGKRYL
jgi:hypothetical protein